MRYFTLVLVLALSLVASTPAFAQENPGNEQMVASSVFDWFETLWSNWFAPNPEKDGDDSGSSTPDPETGDDGSDSGPDTNATGFGLPNG